MNAMTTARRRNQRRKGRDEVFRQALLSVILPRRQRGQPVVLIQLVRRREHEDTILTGLLADRSAFGPATGAPFADPAVDDNGNPVGADAALTKPRLSDGRQLSTSRSGTTRSNAC